ncbi:transketolase, partial [candidate division KSB3 bacterium]|nr:transketolase [candidate division KSB3 bacterium]MBD3326852.1 transketolase [candidate division KSB3 bacterium]
MRNAFAAELTSLAADNRQIILLSGDIGNRLFNDYKAQFPDRFFNCGVAEANMTSMAAGMALCGLRPITYTITPFATTRCLEQIRVDICYHNVPVIIAGVGGGLSYAGLGATHHSCEDIGFLRMLPNMTVICPGDAWEVRLALRAAVQHTGPVYLRIGKKGEPVVHSQAPEFTIGKGIVVQEGTEICLLST